MAYEVLIMYCKDLIESLDVTEYIYFGTTSKFILIGLIQPLIITLC